MDKSSITDVDRAAYLRDRAKVRRSDADIATNPDLRALHLHMASELEGQAAGLDLRQAPAT